MRRLERLISQVRSSTSNKSVSKITNVDMANYFNLAQDAIQSIAMSSDSGARLFSKTDLITLVQNQEKYDLPIDVYSPNAISAVRMNQGSDQYFPIEKITDKERQRGYGYSVIGDSIYISPIPKWTAGNNIELTYQRSLPRLGIRSGTITNYVAGTLSLSSMDNDTLDSDDFFCIVDSNGVIKQSALPIISVGVGSIVTSSGLTITNGDFVVVGKYATTHCELIDFCERFLLAYVERKIQAVESSSDFGTTNLFTNEERQEMKDNLSQTSADTMYPPITNTDYLWL